MSSPIQLPVLIGTIATKVDGSVKINLETREFKPDEAAKLFQLRGSEAWVLIAPQEFREEDVRLPSEKPDPALRQKTPSQAFRDRLFVYFTHALNGNKDEFDNWYKRELNRLGERYLEKVHEDEEQL